MRSRVLALGLMLIAVGVFASGGISGAISQIPKDVLVLGRLISDAVSLDPAQAFEFTSVWVDDQIYDTLVAFSRDFSKAEPELAESWTVSADGKTYTFKIRKGVKFHSGNEVDADAVVFSLQRVFRLKLTPSFIVTSFIASEEDVKTVDVDGDGWKEVEITFNQAMPEVMMTSVLANPVTAVVDPKVVQANATADDPLANKWMSTNDAGAGPFKLVKWERNVEIVLEPFQDYWRGWGSQPKLRQIIMREMPEPTVQKLALERGDIDAAMDLLPHQYKELKGETGIVVKESPTFSLRYLAMNVGYEPFNKKEVRNAVKWAIDYEAIADIWERAMEVGQSIVPARMFAHLPLRPYQKDVLYCKDLLKQAGYEGGFKAELLTVADPPLPDVAAKIKEDLAECGIEIEVKQLRSADLLGIYRKQQHQMVIARWGADYPDPDNLAKAFADFDMKQLAWRNQWDHPVVKQLVKQAVVELDPAKRKQLYEEIQRITLDEGPYAVFAYPLNQIAISANVKNLEPSPLYETFDLRLVYKE